MKTTRIRDIFIAGRCFVALKNFEMIVQEHCERCRTGIIAEMLRYHLHSFEKPVEESKALKRDV